MDARQALGSALKAIRSARGLTQEDFSDVSSRTYLSTLERGLKSPTMDKMQALAEVLEVHPLTIMACTFTIAEERSVDELLAKVKQELRTLGL
ncbi:MAG: helix-turn-helix transcriptional regulator [Anaerolineales bacterium]|nr:helix-turn-helix transcriptional regulator [Anaerolineales bacterium]